MEAAEQQHSTLPIAENGSWIVRARSRPLISLRIGTVDAGCSGGPVHGSSTGLRASSTYTAAPYIGDVARGAAKVKGNAALSRTLRARWITRGVVLVSLLVGLEVLARIAEPAIDKRVQSISATTADRYDAILDRAAKGECIDIDVVGSSHALVGIDTELMAAAWPGEPRPSTYNAALQSFSVGVWPKWVADVVMGDLKPRNLVLSVDTGLDWAARALTPLYPQDLARLEVSDAQGTGGPASLSAFLRYRTVFKNWSKFWGPQSSAGPGFSEITDWGTIPQLARLPEFTQASDGVLPIVPDEQIRADAMPGFTEADGRRALRDSITAALRGGANVFVLDPPAPEPTNLVGDDLSAYDEKLKHRRAAIADVADEMGVPMVVLPAELTDPRSWSALHFNVWGADKATRALTSILFDAGVRADPDCAAPAAPTTSVLPPFPAVRTRTKL